MAFSLDTLQDPEQLAAASVELALNLALAVAIFFVGKWIAAGLLRLMRSTLRRARVDETLGDFLSNVLYGLAIAVIVLAALGTLGVNTTSAAAVLGGAALAIGLSLQSQLSSFAAGVVIILFRPFSKGDYVEVSGIQGVVEEIKIVSTQLRTLDNKQVIIPNSRITENVITNYTARPTRRLDLTIRVGYGAELLTARRVLEEIVAAEPRVLREPAPVVQVRALTDNAVHLAVQPWVRTPDAGDVEATLLQAIKLRFDEAGISPPQALPPPAPPPARA